jgi:hypothetical protein
LHYVKAFFEKQTLNNDIEFNKIIFSWNCNHYNFIYSFNLNTFDMNLLKLNSSLEENAHILNKASLNIKNIGNKNVHEKTYNYFEDTNNLMTLQQTILHK